MKGNTMARVNGIKREVKRLTRHLEDFISFRDLKMNPEQHEGNENRIQILEKRLAELKK
jgi:hypothetical protein